MKTKKRKMEQLNKEGGEGNHSNQDPYSFAYKTRVVRKHK